MIHAANTLTYDMANDDEASKKKWLVTAWSGMSCCLQTRRPEIYCWPVGL